MDELPQFNTNMFIIFFDLTVNKNLITSGN